jgi:hypothetical protein
MAKKTGKLEYSVAKLQSMLERQRAEIARLSDKRRDVIAQLEELNATIARLTGDAEVAEPIADVLETAEEAPSPRRSRSRTRNEKSLADTVFDALQDAATPLKVNDLVQAIKQGGYKSKAANFRSMVNQVLIKDSRFSKIGHGVYGLA